jgi:hypothetical protein
VGISLYSIFSKTDLSNFTALTDDTIQDAAGSWPSPEVEARYGPIFAWNTTAVTNMASCKCLKQELNITTNHQPSMCSFPFFLHFFLCVFAFLPHRYYSFTSLEPIITTIVNTTTAIPTFPFLALFVVVYL